jgi:polysaccharide biosynthesis protein PslH
VPTARVVSIPLGLQVPPAALDAAGGTRRDVVFVGGYSHPPNADAALRLMQSIVPKVRGQVADVRLQLVGDAPTPAMLRAAGPGDAITGRVEDVTPFLERAQLVVLPLRLGGGARVKLLEALAAGKAVVASPLAAAGVDVADGRELVLAETDEEFADVIVGLLRDDARRGALGRAARSWALDNLGWDARVAEYDALYRSVLATRS